MKNTIAFSLFAFTFSLALCATAGGAKHIDFEHHYISTNYFNYCATRAAEQNVPWFDAEKQVLHTWYGDIDYSKSNYSTNSLYTDHVDLGELRLAEMDRAGIDVAVLSCPTPVDNLPAEDAVALARKSNDDVYNATKKYPDRFMGAALLPTLQVTAACTELERCIKELGFKYWQTSSTILGPDGKTHHIWESEFEPLLAKAAELNVCIYLHPEFAPEPDYWDLGSIAYAGPGMAFGLDVMQTATHLVMNGTFDKYPNLRIILGHMGEYLPYVLDRMNFHQNLYLAGAPNVDPVNMKCKETLYHYVVTNANFVVSTSGSADTNAFLCAKEALGADRIVFASDWPAENYTNSTAFIDKCPLTDAEKDGVWSDNAARYIFHESRAPDYARESGKDWLFNHAIKGKQYENEATNDNGVDLFYVYPTLAGGEIVIDGFRGIDDATMRGDEVPSFETAAGAFHGNARCFADMTRVYAPFYRQSTTGKAMDCATNELGQIKATANADYLTALYNGPAYADVTNALETYFTKWNNGRKFILAGHSQGSAMLRLVMENYFTLPENKDKAKLLVASYQIGFGVSKAKVDKITEATKTDDFAGIRFATDATNTAVIVSYNLFGPGAKGNSVLLPDDAIAINPITWTTTGAKADKSLNLGALTNEVPERIVYGLYGATVNANRGTVECAELPESDYIGAVIFGEKSLHGQDYAAFWEDLHKNAYDRITAATGKPPVVGQPTDYADKENWMAFGGTNKTDKTDKPFDVFYLYPMSAISEVDYVGEIDDGMKEVAAGHYATSVLPLEPYANVYAPYYRQLSTCAMSAYPPTADGAQLNFARHVGKTDTFAALDYYFGNVNPNGKRPFVLAGHSQGSASLKNIFEQYFTGEKKGLLKNMVACYALGWTFSTDWCKQYGYTFATGASDTNVVLTWNAEAVDAPALEYLLTSDPHGLAINPLNWKMDNTYAPITENLGSYKDGELIPGGADARLDPVNRPGALIVSNTVFGSEYYAGDPTIGEKSYHFVEWGMFRENVCDNILERGKDMTGYVRFSVPNLPEHVRTSGANADGVDLSAVGGGYWTVASATSVAIAVTPTNENPSVVFANGEREMSLAMKFEGGAWVTVMSEAEIKAATETSDTPKVQLGVVAQRYPWNGMLDIQYRTQFANASAAITFYANGEKIGEAWGTGGRSATASCDLNAVEAFMDKVLTNVEVTATISADDISADAPQDATDSKSAAESAWVEGDAGREIAIDTRWRIVVATPEAVLPFAYSTNNWGEYAEANYVQIYTNDCAAGASWMSASEGGYAQWTPPAGAYGKYDFVQKWSKLVSPNPEIDYGTINATIYYSQPYALTWSEAGGTLAVTASGEVIESGAAVLGYDLVRFTAQPGEGYVLSHNGFKIWTNGVESAIEVLDKDGVYKFEMPNASVEIKGGFIKRTGMTVNGEDIALGCGEGWEYTPASAEQTGVLNLRSDVVGKFTLAGALPPCTAVKTAKLDNPDDRKLEEIVLDNFTNDVSSVKDTAALVLNAPFRVTLVGTNYLASGAGQSAILFLYLSAKGDRLTLGGTGFLEAVPGRDENGAQLPGIDTLKSMRSPVEIVGGTYTGTIDPSLVPWGDATPHRAGFANQDVLGTWTVKSAGVVEYRETATGTKVYLMVTNALNETLSEPVCPSRDKHYCKGWINIGKEPTEYWNFAKDKLETDMLVLGADMHPVESDTSSFTFVPAGGTNGVSVGSIEKAVEQVPIGGTIVVINTNPVVRVEKPLIMKTGEGANLEGIAAGEGLVKKVGIDGTAYIGEATNGVVVVKQEAGVADPDGVGVVVQSEFAIVDASEIAAAATNCAAKSADALVASIKLHVEKQSAGTGKLLKLDLTPVLTLTTVKDGSVTSEIVKTNDFAFSGEPMYVKIPCGDLNPVAAIHVHDGVTTVYRRTTDPTSSDEYIVYDAVANTVEIFPMKYSPFTFFGEEPYEELQGQWSGDHAAGSFTLNGCVAKSGATVMATKSIEIDNLSLEGPLALYAPEGGITNKHMTWNLKNDNHAAKLENFDALVSVSQEAFGLRVDQNQIGDNTFTNEYVIADRAKTAKGLTFAVSAVGFNMALVVNGDPVIDGKKTYSIFVNANDQLVFRIDSAVMISYEALGGAWADGATMTNAYSFSVAGYQFPTVNPTRDNYMFLGWYRSWTNDAEQVKQLSSLESPLSPLTPHSLYAKWNPVSTKRTSRDLAFYDIANGQPRLTIDEFAYAQASYPSQIFETLVTPFYLQSIGKGAFQGVTTLKTLIITPPRSYADPHVPVALTIGQKAFASCTSLEEIRIPGEVTFIDRTAFDNCAKLKRIVFTGTNTISCGAKAFYRCGYDNGDGELKVYMTQAFKNKNASLLADLQAWNTTLVVTPLVGVSPAAGEAQISATDFGSIGADRKVALLVKVPTVIPGMKPEVSQVVVRHSSDLSNWTVLTPDTSEASEDGTVLVEVTMPQGSSGFLKVEIQ